MSEYMFGLGNGWLPKRADQIARKHNAYLVNYTDPQCKCGRGCDNYKCKASRRHWFSGPNHGSPFDGDMAQAVKNDLAAAGIENGEEADMPDEGRRVRGSARRSAPVYWPPESMTYKQLLEDLEAVEARLELMQAEQTNAAHFTRRRLANMLARAREALEALAEDEKRRDKER